MQRPKRREGTQRPVGDGSNSPVPIPAEQNGIETENERGGLRGGEELRGSGEQRGAENHENLNVDTTRAARGSPISGNMYGSYIDPVPVVIVGSHYDKLEGQSALEAVRQTQQLVEELRDQFEEYLNISPRLYPLNCLSSVSKEIKELKERLCEVRSELIEVSSFNYFQFHFNMYSETSLSGHLY